MFNAFIDDSRSEDGRFFVLAGFIATAKKWATFSDQWLELLDMHPRLSRFKMNEMTCTPERLERAQWFYRVIEEHVQSGISCVIRIDDLIKVNRTFEWPSIIQSTEKLENPYYFAFNAIIDKLAQYQERMGIVELIDFVFDEQTEKKAVLEQWDAMKFSKTGVVRRLMGDTPIFRNDEKVLPLQASDFFAWWVRRWRMENTNYANEPLPLPWKLKREIPRLDILFEEKDFLEEYAKYRDPATFNAILYRARLSNETIRALIQPVKGTLHYTLTPYGWKEQSS